MSNLFYVSGSVTQDILYFWRILLFPVSTYSIFQLIFTGLFFYSIANTIEDLVGTPLTTKIFILGVFSTLITFYLQSLIFPNHFVSGMQVALLVGLFTLASLIKGYEMNIFTFNVKLSIICVVILLIYIILSPELTGVYLFASIFGYFYIKFIRGELQLGFQAKAKKSKMRVTHSTYSTQAKQDSKAFYPSEDEINSILDKISVSGYDSLTSKEKERLKKASKQD
ncbi:MAG: DUF6576 domain-containing protein [Leadbetterella sp.]